jgi:hypothetical protein
MRQSTVEVNGQKFELQTIPFMSYMQIVDRCTSKHGVLLREPYTKALFEHCVIKPKVDLSTFDDDFETGMMLVTEIESFLQSKKVPLKNEQGEKE